MRHAWGTFVDAVTGAAEKGRATAASIGGAPGLIGAVVIVLACLAWRVGTGDSRADAQIPLLRGRAPAAAPAAPPAPAQPQAPAPRGAAGAAKGGSATALQNAPKGPAQPPEQKLAAMVNGAEIPQAQLAEECVARHGATVLEAIVNKLIIEQGCKQQGISVGAEEVDAEIDVMAKRFNLPRDKWIELIRDERGVTAQQYADEIVWPMLALRRLAHAGIEPTPEELVEAHEHQFGPAVKARIIVLRTQAEAERIRAEVLAKPEEFGAHARQHSIDVGSASANGWVQPIRRHTGEPRFEAVAFGLPVGGISEVVQVADQFIILKCEGHLPAADVALEAIRPRLVEELREKKSREASSTVFRRLQETAKVENVMNDPARAAALPGVAALVNGAPVSIDRVRQACLDRHGLDVLEILVTRTLLSQAMAKGNVSVTQADIEAEVRRGAEAMGFRRDDGTPDTAAWLERVTRDDKVPLKHYLDDIVQPTVALKKLVGKVPVSQEDLDKAFAATFGPRAKCRVVILDTQRRAQEVWQLARQNPSAERIGDLAEKYSVDPTTRALRGEVPPIQRFGGQPSLEREVFSLKPGELSGVVQIADRFMVFFCEGFTEPQQVRFEEVRDELYVDIEDKKQRIEMGRYFTHLREGAAIDNFVAGTSQSGMPAEGNAVARGAMVPPGGSPQPTLSKQQQDELSRPRAGSRRAVAPPAVDPGVQPASFDAPAATR
jgi:parvulin-like peptidyl-prolyl isomerase